jgi:DNA-binding HxlR family transcriptional regulator
MARERARSYGDACGIARALDLIGERWALLVVRELILGPKRFTDLRRSLPHVSTDILTQRLHELERDGIVHRRRLPPPASARVYELTERGHGLQPVVLELGRWGTGAPVPEGDAELGVDSMVLALMTVFDGAPGARDETYELVLAGEPFRIRVAGGELDVSRGEADDPDAVIEADPATLPPVLWRGRSLADAIAAGEITVSDRDAAKRFVELFAYRG